MYLNLFFSRNITFELWADRVKLLEAQDIFSAFASYYELAFVFQLEYPKECQTISQVIQEKVARYGSVESGVNMTKSRTKTVTNKLEKYNRLSDSM